MSRMQDYKHWRLKTDDEKVLWLYFDKQNASVNTIDKEVMEELSSIMDNLQNDKDHKGVVIASGKKNGFIAGADISQFNKFKDIDQAVQMLRQGQGILDKIENLKLPTVAMINGFCVGGGLELALACRFRVADDDAKVRLGLPEVKLGIQPGWGGSVRLPRLIGALQAMGMILTGRTVSGKAAAKMGFVDVAVPTRHLEKAARYYATHNPPKHEASIWQKLSNTKLARMILANVFRKQLRAKIIPSHYPAPFHVVENWEEVGVADDQAMQREARTCGKLFFSDTSENLVRVFFLQERMKGLAKEVKFKAKHVHVIGAGTMGGDIAAWCALQGMTVTLQDREPKYIAPAIKRAYKLYQEKLKETHLVQKAMDRLMPDVQGYGVSRADVIIEAIFEDLTAKQNLFEFLETKAKPNAILATNTSSIPLDKINAVMKDKSRLVGIHFFNPVAKMLLVEIVQGDVTNPHIVQQAIAFARQLDRLPLPVKSSPGFLVNRVLMPYLLEAVQMLKEGVPPEVLDKAMVDFGMPMGPVTLADTIGLDVCLSVAKYLSDFLHTPVPPELVALVEKGKLGRKTGEGFYKYNKAGKPIKNKNVEYNKPLETISDRLVLRMLDEAFACLREHVVADADLLDAGMIFGTGFAPFRGGPIHYAKTKGIHELYNQYVKQRQQLGEKIPASHEWESSSA